MNDADPRVKRTRKLILDAFQSLLMEKAFHAITVQDIADRATLNRATFYAHFVDKRDLLDNQISAWFQELLSRRQLKATPFTLDNLRRLIVSVLEALAEIHGHCSPPHDDLDSSIEAKARQQLCAFLRAWLATVQQIDGREPVSAETTASVLSWAIFGAAIEWSRSPANVSADDRARQVVTLLTRGLGHVLNVPGLPRKPANGGNAREATRANRN
jgi:AcrR family transcriptional regulator